MAGKDDDELDRQMRNLAGQLTDDKVREIADRLGLRDHEKPRKPTEAPEPKVVDQDDGSVCSFCGGTREQVGVMIRSRSGACICRGCLSSMSG